MSAFRAGAWSARWVWADVSPDRTSRQVVALRRTLHLDSVPTAAPTRIASTDRFVFRVNGREMIRGPLRTDPRRRLGDLVDIASLLKPGDNTIALLVCHDPHPMPWSVPVPAVTDLADGAVALEARIGDELVVTDESWQGRLVAGWTSTAAEGVKGRGIEMLRLGSLPAGWDSSDIGWAPVRLRRAFARGENGRVSPPSYPVGPHGYRAVSYPQLLDVDLKETTPGAWVADALVFGTVVVDATVPIGAQINVSASEFLDRDGTPAPVQYDAGFIVSGSGEREAIETLDSYGARGLLVTGSEAATVHRVTVRQRLQPVSGDAYFACSDPQLEKIWRVGRNTVTLCTADSYLDCPTREQRAWTGDSVVHQMVDLTTNSDWSMARWHPVLAASPRPDGMLPMAVVCDFEQADRTIIPDWALHWIRSVWNLYRYVGDEEAVAALLPVAEGVLRWFLPFRTDEGVLADVYGWNIIDWSSVYTFGVSAAINGLWGRALLDFADMTEWLGDNRRARWSRSLHQQLRIGFEMLWDPELERYADTCDPDGRGPTASQHGQSVAIVGGLAPEQRWPRLVELLTDDERLVYANFSAPDGPAGPNSEVPIIGDYLAKGHPAKPWWNVRGELVRAQPFFRYVVHDAIAAAGRADLLAQLCLDWTVLLERTQDTWSEVWFGGTSCHGWSSTPTRDLVTRVLGVTPAAPGCTVVSVDPALGYLDHASGRVPTPLGMIEVSVDRSQLRVNSPVPVQLGRERHPPGEIAVPNR